MGQTSAVCDGCVKSGDDGDLSNCTHGRTSAGPSARAGEHRKFAAPNLATERAEAQDEQGSPQATAFTRRTALDPHSGLTSPPAGATQPTPREKLSAKEANDRSSIPRPATS